MNGVRWISRCAVVVFSIVGMPMIAHSQDDPFGMDPIAVEGRFGEPTPVAGRTAKGEKPVLAGDAPVQAQPKAEFCQCIGQANSPAVGKIEKALRARLRQNGLNFVDTPLEEVINAIQADYGIPIQLDTPALDEIGLGPDVPATIHLHNISLESALRLMLKQLQLTYAIRDEVLMITTPKAADAHLLTCVYDIRSIVDDPSERTVKPLIETILSCVATETWAQNGGGEAEIRMPTPGLLVISQTQAVHRDVRGLLKTLRDMSGKQPAVEKTVSVR